MNSFEPKLLANILIHLDIQDILRTCSALTPTKYQSVCKNSDLWKSLLYRDYEIFSSLIKTLERESDMSYRNLYQEFYFNPFFNSDDFRQIYQFFQKYGLIVEFYNSDNNITIIPELKKQRKGDWSSRRGPRRDEKFSNMVVEFTLLENNIPNELPVELEWMGYNFELVFALAYSSYARTSIKIQAKLVNGKLLFHKN